MYCLRVNNFCSFWGDDFNTISNKDICYAMSCGDSHLRFLTRKKTHKKPLYMINHVIIHIQLKRLNQAVFSQNAFLLRVLCWIMLYSSDHNEFFMTIMNSLYPNISEPFLLGSLPSQTTFLKRTFKISVHQKTYWH
jgi:hypothetical protein